MNLGTWIYSGAGLACGTTLPRIHLYTTCDSYNNWSIRSKVDWQKSKYFHSWIMFWSLFCFVLFCHEQQPSHTGCHGIHCEAKNRCFIKSIILNRFSMDQLIIGKWILIFQSLWLSDLWSWSGPVRFMFLVRSRVTGADPLTLTVDSGFSLGFILKGVLVVLSSPDIQVFIPNPLVLLPCFMKASICLENHRAPVVSSEIVCITTHHELVRSSFLTPRC